MISTAEHIERQADTSTRQVVAHLQRLQAVIDLLSARGIESISSVDAYCSLGPSIFIASGREFNELFAGEEVPWKRDGSMKTWTASIDGVRVCYREWIGREEISGSTRMGAR